MQCIETPNGELNCELDLFDQAMTAEGSVSYTEGVHTDLGFIHSGVHTLEAFACFEKDEEGECNGTGASMYCYYYGEEGQFEGSYCSFGVKEDTEGRTTWFACYDGEYCVLEDTY